MNEISKFHRLSVTNDVLQELKHKLLEIEDVECSLFKQSLHVYKDLTKKALPEITP